MWYSSPLTRLQYHHRSPSKDVARSPPNLAGPLAYTLGTTESMTGTLEKKQNKILGSESWKWQRASLGIRTVLFPAVQQAKSAHLWRCVWWNWAWPAQCLCRFQKGCRHRPCQRGVLQVTTRWEARHGSFGEVSTQEGCRLLYLEQKNE